MHRRLARDGLNADLFKTQNEYDTWRNTLISTKENQPLQQSAAISNPPDKLPENKNNQQSKSNYYPHQVNSPHDKKRFHAFEVNVEKYASLKERYRDAKGDYLKSSILADFQNKIENTSSKEELETLVRKFKLSDEYKVLEKGQGLVTKVLGLETSSVKALKEMIEAQENNLPTQENKLK